MKLQRACIPSVQVDAAVDLPHRIWMIDVQTISVAQLIAAFPAYKRHRIVCIIMMFHVLYGAVQCMQSTSELF